jgi:hypothetical protein
MSAGLISQVPGRPVPHTPPPSSSALRSGGANGIQPISRAKELTAVLLALVALLSRPTPARAHDAFEIWTIVVLRADHLELGITMAQSTALRLIEPQRNAGAISVENFAAHRARLEQEAATLCLLTSGRKPLPARAVDVELTDENDIVFKVTYPRPAPGPLHFHARCLKKLGAGYGGIFDASESDGRHLGWEQLSFENPNYEISIPGSPPTRK